MRLGLAIALLTFLVTNASANIVGDLKTGSGGTMTFSLSTFTFNPDPSSNPPGPPWNGEVANGTNLRFAGCPSGVLGTAGCLDAAPFAPTEAIEFANNTSINLGAGLGPNNPFIQFAGNGVTHATLLYTLTAIGPGSSNTNCAGLTIGDSCSLFAGSPIILTDQPTGTTVTIPLLGVATDGTGVTNWVGDFQVPLAGMSPQQIQLFFCPSGTCTAADFSSGRSLDSSQSGDFVATTLVRTPEPASLSLLLAGFASLLCARRRRR